MLWHRRASLWRSQRAHLKEEEKTSPPNRVIDRAHPQMLAPPSLISPNDAQPFDPCRYNKKRHYDL